VIIFRPDLHDLGLGGICRPAPIIYYGNEIECYAIEIYAAAIETYVAAMDFNVTQ
jgi:hypothetical protein